MLPHGFKSGERVTYSVCRLTGSTEVLSDGTVYFIPDDARYRDLRVKYPNSTLRRL